MSNSSHPWYKSGLRFSCTQCGQCCTGPEESYVLVTQSDCRRMARYLGMSLKAFVRRHTEPPVKGSKCRRLTVGASGNCCFYSPSDRGCHVHPAKPRQCRAFPFWRQHLESPDHWVQVARHCEGVGQGEVVHIQEIGRLGRLAHPQISAI